MPFFRPVKTKKRSKRYDKVSHKCKVLLLKKVLCDHSEIKETAEQLQINYSTAKTLMRKYKYHGNAINTSVLEGICSWYAIYEVQRARCTYKVVQTQISPVKIEENKPSPEEYPTHNHNPTEEYPLNHINMQPPTPVQILQQVLFKH